MQLHYTGPAYKKNIKNDKNSSRSIGSNSNTVEEVWVQLYVEGKGNSGRAFRVQTMRDLEDLAKVVYQEKGKTLGHCNAADLVFYRAGKEFPSKENDRLRPCSSVPQDTTAKIPLRVVAPAISDNAPNGNSDTLGKYVILLSQLIREIKLTNATPSISAASFGENVIKTAKDNGIYCTFNDVPGEEPALTQTIVNELARCKTKHQLVAMLTPHFKDIFSDSACLVNSEGYAWIKQSKKSTYNSVPDMFLCHEAMYTNKRKPLSPMSTIHERRGTVKFGKLSDWELCDCLAATIKATLSIDYEAIGQTANYGSHILSDANDLPVTRLILFDKTHFLLMEAYPRRVFRIEECKWTQPGTKEHLREFPLYNNPWTVLVKNACKKWQLETARDTHGSAWLGHGKHGRVFRVRRAGTKKHMALKVVKQPSAPLLSCEKAMLHQAAVFCDCVMPIERPEKDLDCALLMSHVGTKVKQDRYQDIIRLLSQLHQEGFLHGDPRLGNVVEFQGKLYWIDFMILPSFQGYLPRLDLVDDMTKFVKTILPHYPKLPDKVQDALNKYDGSAETTEALIQVVRKILK